MAKPQVESQQALLRDQFGTGRRSTNRMVDKASVAHLLGIVKIASIKDHGLRHPSLHLKQIRRLKLLPFRHDGQSVCILQRFHGIATILNLITELLSYVRHGFRIMNSHAST